MIHEMNLNPEPFERIAQGRKVFEIRLNDEKRRLLHVGDYIVFTNRTDGAQKMHVLVMDLVRKPSFADLFNEIGTKSAGWSIETTPAEASKDMRKFYSAEEEHQYGVVGIKIERADESRL